MKEIFTILFLLINYINAKEINTPKIILSPSKLASWTVVYETKIEAGEEFNISTPKITPGIYDGTSPKKKSVYLVATPVSLRTVHHIGGVKQDFYYFHNNEFSQFAQQKGANSMAITTDPEQQFRKRIPGVHWVTADFYKGKKMLKGKECLYFSDSESKIERAEFEMYFPDLKFTPIFKEAWFDIETGLPLAFKIGSEEGYYQFESANEQKVIVPEAIKKEMHNALLLEQYQKKVQEPGKLAPY